ncbi:MAG TPA: accessory factor UbiK family protein [Gammaproteobacteria bacterium]|nr:accessory factor UbiK family protein [Gammaproteobacteria bacterium]
MLDPKSLDEMARKLAQNLPPGLRDFQQEVERNMRAGLQGMFSRLDLVTREEFDAQAKVLARTRAHLETLEMRVAALEAAPIAAAEAPAGKKTKTAVPPPPEPTSD